MEPDMRALEVLISRIVDVVKPVQIILFGSATRAAESPRDIDLLVVMPNGTHRRQTAQRLYREIRGLGVPFDILVATPNDLDRHKENIGLIYRTIVREGKQVYAA